MCALVLGAVFGPGNRREGPLSIHPSDPSRRELFYWAAVVATFAMGTAVGDLTAVTLHLGYLLSAVLFACMIAVPAIGYRWLGWNSILSFCCAYLLTRPLGASVAPWLGQPPDPGGLAWGRGPLAL